MKYTMIVENIGTVATKLNKKDLYSLCIHYIATKPEQSIDILEENNNYTNDCYTIEPDNNKLRRVEELNSIFHMLE